MHGSLPDTGGPNVPTHRSCAKWGLFAACAALLAEAAMGQTPPMASAPPIAQEYGADLVAWFVDQFGLAGIAAYVAVQLVRSLPKLTPITIQIDHRIHPGDRGLWRRVAGLKSDPDDSDHPKES